jgi:hypothetical protein
LQEYVSEKTQTIGLLLYGFSSWKARIVCIVDKWRLTVSLTFCQVSGNNWTQSRPSTSSVISMEISYYLSKYIYS